MLQIRIQNQFKKDIKRAQMRGRNVELLREVIQRLANEETLELKFRDHSLRGNYVDCRECHIQPDFLLIYRLTDNELQLVRAGTHSDLFK
jgi:mRNA interferase YafQ